VSPAKAAEPIVIPFEMWTRVGLRNHVSDGDPDPHTRRGNFEDANELAQDMSSVRYIQSASTASCNCLVWMWSGELGVTLVTPGE